MNYFKITHNLPKLVLCFLFAFSAVINQGVFAAADKCPTGASVAPTTDQTLCLGSTATALTTTITTSGSALTKVRYTWWYNTTNSTDTTTATQVKTATNNLGSSKTNSYTPANNTVGTRYYFCVVTNAICSSMYTTATVKVTINAPTITVSSSSSKICNPGGSAVTLTADGGLTYVWSANGSSTNWALSSTTDNPVTALPTATKTYKVTGTDGSGCSNTANVVISVGSVSFSASASPAAICPGASSILKTNKNTYTFVWNPGAMVGDNISVTPTTTTSYTVTGTTALGCTLTKQTVVTVRPLPIVTVSPSTSSFCGTASSTLLTGTVTNVAPTTGARTYSWSTGATTSTISVMPTSTTVYTLTGTDGKGCTKSASATITINPIPVVTANASAMQICPGGSVTLTGGGATSYSWSGGVTNGISFIPLATNTYSVTGTTNGCTNSAQVTVALAPCAPPIATVIIGAKDLCGLTTVTYSTPAIPGATSYTWNVTGGLSVISGQGTNTIVVSIPAGFANGGVAVYASNAVGNGPTRYISVYNVPISIILSGPAFVCGLSQATYTCSQSATALSYFWTIPSGTSIVSGQGTQTLTISFNNNFTSGNLYIQNQTACGLGASRSIKINTSPLTAPRYISGPRDLCNMATATFTSDIVTTATSYSWTVPPGLTIASGQGTSSIVVNVGSTFGAGNIGVSAVSACGTSAAVYLNERRLQCPVIAITSADRNFEESAGTIENSLSNEVEKSVTLFPNPTNGENLQLTFEGFDVSENVLIQVYDITGKMMMNISSSLEKIKTDYLFNVKSFPNGIYLVKISQDDQQWNNKLIISK